MGRVEHMKFCDEIAAAGFAILPERVSRQCVDSLLNQVDQRSTRRTRAGVRHAMGLRPVAALTRHTELMQLARQVLGQDAFPFRATLFNKSPESNWLVVWHQDTALPLQGRSELPGWGPWSVKEEIHYAHAPASALSQVLALRVHLDDSTRDNGPLRVLPGTHQLGVLTDDAIHNLARRIDPVECVVAKGGVVAMRPLLIHASSKSQAALPRKVLHIEYAASASIAEPLQLAIA